MCSGYLFYCTLWYMILNVYSDYLCVFIPMREFLHGVNVCVFNLMKKFLFCVNVYVFIPMVYFYG